MYKVLKTTRIDMIEYVEADVQSVFENLSEQYGVHFIIPAARKHRIRKVNMELERVSLLEVVQYICEIAGLNFRVEDKAVFISGNARI